MKKIKNAKITFILKKLIAYVFVAHKLFTKELFKKQIIKLLIRNFEINVKKKLKILIFMSEFSRLDNLERSNSVQNIVEFENQN